MSGNSQSTENQKRQFDEEQYKMLLRCSEKKDMTEWNEWRERNVNVKILLQKSLFPPKTYLKGANLRKANLENANLEGANLQQANLEGAHLEEANIIDAELGNANLESSILWKANLEGANLKGANLKGAYLMEGNLGGVYLSKGNLEGASLLDANLEGATLLYASLESAYLWRANLKGADLSGGNLKGTYCHSTVLDGKTLLWDCTINEETDFTGSGLDSARVEPRLKVALQGNIRRKQWEIWYREGSKLKQRYKKLIVKPFWWVSDYGRSTSRIIGCFFGLSVMFALLYLTCGLFDRQGIIANLFIDYNTPTGNPISISPCIIPIRAIYFSIVTMTTLGFGDMYAQSGSFLGHILLTIQVLLGYILLGALVTRFAILFTSSGPAMTISKKEQKNSNAINE